MFMIGDAGYTISLPHLLKKCRAVPLPVKNQDKPA
jgi:hypothetical protein